MAKGKYEEWLQPEGLLKLEAWARNGLTDEQIAKNMGVAPKTLYRWKEQHSQICQSLKKGKEVVDITVENALYKKALGYTVKLKKTFKTKHVIYDEATGRKLEEHERLEVGIDEIHIPADTVAQIFWLKNRKPEDWRDKRDVAVSGAIPVVIADDVNE